MTTKVCITNVEGNTHPIAALTVDIETKRMSNRQRVKPGESVDLHVHFEQGIRVVELLDK